MSSCLIQDEDICRHIPQGTRDSLERSFFTATGPLEVKRPVDMVSQLIIGNVQDPQDRRKQIFSEGLHIGMDNYFSGDIVLQYLGERG